MEEKVWTTLKTAPTTEPGHRAYFSTIRTQTLAILLGEATVPRPTFRDKDRCALCTGESHLAPECWRAPQVCLHGTTSPYKMNNADAEATNRDPTAFQVKSISQRVQNQPSKMLNLSLTVRVCVSVCVRVDVPRNTHWGQSTTCGNWLSPSTERPNSGCQAWQHAPLLAVPTCHRPSISNQGPVPRTQCYRKNSIINRATVSSQGRGWALDATDAVSLELKFMALKSLLMFTNTCSQ